MTELERAAVEACNAAGWVSMGVGDGSGQLFVYGPSDAIHRAQKLIALRSPSPRSWEEIAKDDLGLQVLRPSTHQIQFRLNGKVHADWWPGKGTTLSDNERGPICKTGEEVLEWLRSL